MRSVPLDQSDLSPAAAAYVARKFLIAHLRRQLERRFDPNQPRDAIGRWTRIGGGGGGGDPGFDPTADGGGSEPGGSGASPASSFLK